MTPDEFFDRRREWSQYKHQILEKYFRIWIYKLSHGHRELAFVDTCAGEGRYDDGAKGSPLIAAQWNGYLSENRRGRLVVHACEAVPETAIKLRAALDPYITARPTQAIVYEHPYYDAMPEILRAVRGKPTLFFVDPYGLKDMAVEHISPILAERKGVSTEVLARIDPGLLARFAGWLRKRDRSPQLAKTAASFQRLLERLNVDTEELIDSMGEDRDAQPDQLRLFRAYLQLFQDRFEYVQIVPIRPSYFAAPKYFLVHGTDSAHGAAFLNDAVSTTEDSLYSNSMNAKDEEAGQVSMFGPAAREPRYSMKSLREATTSILTAEGRPMQFIKLRAELALLFGPDFREKHHKAAVRSLIEQRVIKRLLAGQLDEKTLLELEPSPAEL